MQSNNTRSYIPDDKKGYLVWILILIGLLVFVAAAAIGNYIFLPVRIDYDKMNSGIKTIEHDGIVSFEMNMTENGAGVVGTWSKVVAYDYENGIKYRFYFYTIKASRYGLWFNNHETWTDRGTTFTETGWKTQMGNEIDPPKFGADYYREHTNEMVTKFLRVYYMSPDGTFTLLWENKDIREILARTNTVINENDISSYVENRTGDGSMS